MASIINITSSGNGISIGERQAKADQLLSTLPIYLDVGDNILNGTVSTQIQGRMGANDYWRIGSGATGLDAGFMEIATANNGNEPIYVRQYGESFNAVSRTLTLLDESGNTTIPGKLILSYNNLVFNNNKVQENAYKFDCAPADTNEHLYYLGEWSRNADAESLYIEFFNGFGYNGRPSQNLKLDIMIKNAWQEALSATKAFGLSYIETIAGEQSSQLNVSNNYFFEVMCSATSHNTCHVYVKIKGGGHYHGWYTVKYSGTGVWTDKGMTEVSSMQGTAQEHRHGAIPGVHIGTSSSPLGWSGNIYIQY